MIAILYGTCVPLQEEQRYDIVKEILFTQACHLQLLPCHTEDLPIPESPKLELPSCTSTSSEEDKDTDFCEASTSEESHFPNQQEIDDLIRNMGMTKENAQLLTSRLKECNLLDPTCKVSKYRKRHLSFAHFFTISQPHSLCYCSDIFGVFNEIRIDYNPADWRLFIDS